MPNCLICRQPPNKRDGYDRSGRQRYTCRPCRRDFTQPSGSAFSGYRWPAEVILAALRWYLRYPLSARQVAELLADITAQVIEFQQDSRIGMRVISGPFPLAWTHTLEQAGEGTRLTTMLEADPGSYFRIAGPLLKPVLQRHFDADHATLKALLEAQVSARS